MKPFSATIAVLFLVSTITYGIIGGFYTFYSMGIFLVPIVLIITVVTGAFCKWVLRKTSDTSLNIAMGGGFLIFSIFIVAHLIDNYKPTVTVNIPEEFEGCVLMFAVESAPGDVEIDDHGIGYYQRMGDFQWKVKHGSTNISGVLNEFHFQQLLFYSSDSTNLTVVTVSCFEVGRDKVYPTREAPWTDELCLDIQEYEGLVESGLIDEAQVLKRHFEIPTP
jgi:hypothetical protein